MTETCFSDTPRIKDNPIFKRVGDDLLERDSGGHVSFFVGYFDPSQIMVRDYQEALHKNTFVGKSLFYKYMRGEKK